MKIKLLLILTILFSSIYSYVQEPEQVEPELSFAKQEGNVRILVYTNKEEVSSLYLQWFKNGEIENTTLFHELSNKGYWFNVTRVYTKNGEFTADIDGVNTKTNDELPFTITASKTKLGSYKYTKN